MNSVWEVIDIHRYNHIKHTITPCGQNYAVPSVTADYMKSEDHWCLNLLQLQ